MPSANIAFDLSSPQKVGRHRASLMKRTSPPLVPARAQQEAPATRGCASYDLVLFDIQDVKALHV